MTKQTEVETDDKPDKQLLLEQPVPFDLHLEYLHSHRSLYHLQQA